MSWPARFHSHWGSFNHWLPVEGKGANCPQKESHQAVALMWAMLGNELSDGEVTRCSAAFWLADCFKGLLILSFGDAKAIANSTRHTSNVRSTSPALALISVLVHAGWVVWAGQGRKWTQDEGGQGWATECRLRCEEAWETREPERWQVKQSEMAGFQRWGRSAWQGSWCISQFSKGIPGPLTFHSTGSLS